MVAKAVISFRDRLRGIRMSEEKLYKGSCLCGALRYEVHGEIGDII